MKKEIAMPQEAEYIKVTVRKLKDWFIATSETLPGLYLADSSYDVLSSIIPEGIQLVYEAGQGRKVTVRPVESANVKTSPGELDFIAKAA